MDTYQNQMVRKRRKQEVNSPNAPVEALVGEHDRFHPEDAEIPQPTPQRGPSWKDPVISLAKGMLDASGSMAATMTLHPSVGPAARALGVQHPYKTITDLKNRGIEAYQKHHSPAWQAEQRKEFVQEVPEGEGWLGSRWKPGEGATSPAKVSDAILGSVPAMAAGMGSGAMATKGFMKLAEKKAIPWMNNKVAGSLGQAIGQGGTAAVTSSNNAYGQAQKLTDEQVLTSPYYRSRYGSDRSQEALDQARDEIATLSAAITGLAVGPTTGALGAPLGRFTGKALGGEGARTTLGAFLKSAGLEGGQEALQEPSQQFIANAVTKVLQDRDQNLWAGLGEAMVGGGMAGTAMGGPLGAMSHRQGQNNRQADLEKRIANLDQFLANPANASTQAGARVRANLEKAQAELQALTGPQGVPGAAEQTATESPDTPRFMRQPQQQEFKTYSEMERVLTKPGMLPKSSSKQGMTNAIKKHVGKFKGVELEESGLIPYIESMKQDMVTSKDVQDYMDMNKIQLQEIRKGAGTDSETRHDTWQIQPVGDNYREIMLVHPTKGPERYKSTKHWEEEDVLLHVRMNERVLPETGENVLFIEEIQSDLHQDARKVRSKEVNIVANRMNISKAEASKIVDKDYGYNKDSSEDTNKVPDAPFKSTDRWSMLAVKRIIQEAIDSGTDRVIWTPGAVQAERFDLRGNISSIEYDMTNELVITDRDGETREYEADAHELEKFVGPEIAQEIQKRLRDNKAHDADWSVEYDKDRGGYVVKNPDGELHTDDDGEIRLFESKGDADWELGDILFEIRDEMENFTKDGLDYVHGGEGMMGFYDNMLPKEVQKYIKKWGSNVEKTDMPYFHSINALYKADEIASYMRDRAREQGFNNVTELPQEVKNKLEREFQEKHSSNMNAWSFQITPQMKEAVAKEGQPLYSRTTGRPAKPISTGELYDKVTDTLRSKLPGLPENIIKISETEADLPPQLQELAKAAGLQGRFPGVFWNGNIYLVAENISSHDGGQSAFAQVLLQHEGRHYALSEIFGTPLKRQAFFNKASTHKKYREDVQAWLQREGRENTPANRAEAAEEVIVTKIKQGETGGVIDQFLAKLAKWLRQVFDIRLTHGEIREMIARADSILAQGQRD